MSEGGQKIKRKKIHKYSALLSKKKKFLNDKKNLIKITDFLKYHIC